MSGAARIVSFMMDSPLEGQDFPGSLPELRAWFRSDADCVDYLDWLRWPDGFVCPWCADVGDWGVVPGMHRCAGCRRRVSVVAGTVFHRTHTPLTVWFEAAWLMMASKQGVSALTLQRVPEIGSYQTAWTMTHKLRSVMSQSGRDSLSGRVEMDETFIGGSSPGTFGRGAAGKTLVAGTIERRGEGFGRARLQIIADASSASRSDFIRAHVSPGRHSSRMGGPPYPRAAAAIEVHNVKASSQPAHPSLPGVHLLFSLTKRVLEGTYQGSVLPERLRGYLDEFVFRFNRRNSHTRGLLFFRLLESAVAGPPTTSTNLAITHRKSTETPVPPPTPHALPRTLAGTPPERPWRVPRTA
nr:IS1595 family transposase [Arthrobacter sp. AQ5-05]